jgi:hypothetical protein
MRKTDESNPAEPSTRESSAVESSRCESSVGRHRTQANFLSRAAAAVALTVLCTIAQPAMGQTDRALEQRLEEATRLDCRFSELVTGDWKDGKPTATVATTTFEASFFDVNVNEGTAEADSRFGPSYIVVRYSNGYLHFVQMLLSGPLRVTTILARQTKDGRLMAIHTRHEYSPTVLPGFTSRPEMYIGDCALES